MDINKRFYIFLLSAIVLIGFLVTSLVGYYVANNSLSERLQEEMLPLTSDNIYSEIQRDLLTPILISSLMANDVFVFDWVNTGEKDPDKMSSYLQQIQKKYETITAFFVSEKTRHYYHASGIVKKVSEDSTEDNWYFEAKNSNAPYVINIDQDTVSKQEINIFVNYRVIDETNQFIGVIGVGLSLETVADLIENYQERYGREVYFVNRQGKVMLQSSGYNRDLFLKNKTGLDKVFVKILTSPGISISFHDNTGSVIYLNSRLVPEFDWVLIVEQINDPDSARIERALIVNIIVSLIISIIVLIIGHFAIRGYHGKLEVMAMQDKLTGVTSRQAFDSYFRQAVVVAKRRDQPLSLVLIDIDLFKKVNDTFGHQAGDRVLSKVAHAIKADIREEDVLCRWGGEEFLLMLSSCNLDKAFQITEKIRQVISELEFHFNDETVSITISAGIAELQYEETLNQVVERADHHLYQAKRAGRNCIKS